ncbi:hypothetical protein [Halosegnis longus]|uniref:hypothetical protein n=1 Tax=Halosegnis longus TaxID=2216012 RepID=UPI00129D9302|nr:hypothetical protein [Halosegnis longus]
MLPDRPDRERRLANTYADRGGQTGWERVEDYREIRRYCAEHPNDGSQAVATAMDMKRGRIRGWVDATSRPEPAHAIEVADQHGWLDCELSDRIGAAWTIAHAWVCAGGSLSGPSFTARFALGDDDPAAALREALNVLGMATTEHGDPDAGRGRELQPAANGSVFGRFLYGILDAPLGAKADGDRRVPTWVQDAPPAVALRWLQTLVSVRGTPVDTEQHAYAVRLQAERRGDAWWQGLATQMRRVCPADSVTLGEQSLLLRPEAAAVLDQPPTLPALES